LLAVQQSCADEAHYRVIGHEKTSLLVSLSKGKFFSEIWDAIQILIFS